MKPRSFQFSDISIHQDDQFVIFTVDDEKLMVVVVCDGVSESTCGHVASAFVCYYIREYFTRHLAGNIKYTMLRALSQQAIKYAADKLVQFSEKIKSSSEMVAESPARMTVNPVPADDTEGLQAGKEVPAEILMQEDLWQEYKTICTDLGYPYFPEKMAKIKASLAKQENITFQSTLSLNLVYENPDDSEPGFNGQSELLSINYGDCELYVVEWSPNTGRIVNFLPHYKIGQDNLHTFINAETPSIYGRPVILTRNLQINDNIIIATDGANVQYTTHSGFPFAPFQNKLTAAKKTGQHNLPKDWFTYLQEKSAINDDYSLVMIEFTRDEENQSAGDSI